MQYIYIYLNGNLKEEERADYLNRIAKFPEWYTSDEYAIKESQMGTIALLTNQTKVSAEEIYIQYKSRSEIEQYFDHYKNTIMSQMTYMQSDA